MRGNRGTAVRVVSAATTLVLVGALTACSDAGGPSSSSEPTGQASGADDLEVTYEHRAGPGLIDRTLTLTNTTDDVLAAELTLEGLDDSGATVDRVTMSTAYGSHRGEMLLGPGENVDVLYVLGPRAPEVTDVRVTVDDLTPVDVPPSAGNLESVALGRDGRPVDVASTAARVRVRNPSPHDLRAGVIYLVYDVPAAGDAQSVQAVAYVDRSVLVPADGSVTVPLDSDLRRILQGEVGRFPGSIKAYRTAAEASGDGTA